MVIVIAIATALLAGFLAGFLCFKKTNEFCGRCGITRQCPVCPEQPAPAPAGQRRRVRMRSTTRAVQPV
ncbi:hypothetical protein [Paractinoplanes hotanensis]|uniref:FeoB-associated Cys-rich membrane protein n=1 Tax=Paractinoplanes hotanensis TaxID=2906497 RepID=A0ABT0YA07_9ACTN|nr:hypothetical protein [Actinoplanes hotanensis]MCM4082874.1 hypothetical protein [Actinoplanes hotanensis]